MVGGFAPASDAIRWTAVEDSLWSFSTLELNLSKLSDSGVFVVSAKLTGATSAAVISAALITRQIKGRLFFFFFNGD